MTRLLRCSSLIAGCIVCLLGIASPAHSTSLSVTPILATLDAQHHSIALTLHNQSNETKVIQTELLRWTQQKGNNVYAPSRDLLINPPIFTLNPGQRQTVRLGLKHKVDAKNELAYRLRLTEVPPPPSAAFTGLRIALRFDIPVFVMPREAQSNLLNWKASRNANGQVLLTLSNVSNRHARIRDIKLSDAANGHPLLDWQNIGYVLLAGQSRQIRLTPTVAWQGKQIEFTAHINDGLVAAKVNLESTKQGQVAQ